MERWKEIDGYEGRYEISDQGRVRSLERRLSDGRLWKSRILKPSLRSKNLKKCQYLFVVLARDGVNKNFPIAIGVAKAFVPNPENLPQVNHEDGDKTHNWARNLKWSTGSGNIQHAVNSGLFGDRTGENAGRAVLTEDQVRVIKERLKNHELQRIIAADFNTSRENVSSIARGNSWGHV